MKKEKYMEEIMKNFKKIGITSALALALMVSACASPNATENTSSQTGISIDLAEETRTTTSLEDVETSEATSKSVTNSSASAENPNMPASLISILDAKSIIQNRFGEPSKLISIELDDLDNNQGFYYEIEMEKEGHELEAKVHAETGEILEYEEDSSDDWSEYASRLENVISLEEAYQLALEEIADSQAYIFDMDLDTEDDDNDVFEYEGKLRSNGKIYEFEIHAEEGTVNFLREDDDQDFY